MEPWEHAETYLGTPFVHRGRTRNQLDCAGLLILVARDLGLGYRNKRVYGREPQNDGLQEFLLKHCGAPLTKTSDELEVNDILLLRLDHKDPSHLAIVTPYPLEGQLGMIHTYGALGRVVRHILDDKWRSRIHGIYAWPAKS